MSYLRGYWRQMAEEGLGDPPLRCIQDQEPLVVKEGWKAPKRTPC